MQRDKADKIIELLEQGKSLRASAREVGISPSSVLDWTEKDAVFAEQYARARAIGYKLLAEEIVEISDSETGDVNRDRLRVDTRKWMLAKMLPKIYGEKLGVEHSGSVNVTLTQTENDL